jgi:Pvc16 N-terminal domain
MLLDLSLVTQTLVNLIGEHVRASPAWNTTVTLTVSPQPRDKLTVDNTIGVYLYHLTEDAHFKNVASVSADTAPIRYTPMGLNLYYQLSAHSTAQDDAATYKEQLLMGLAIKALRDYPTIDESTQIGGQLILPGALRGEDNRFRLSLLPVTHNEALNFSTSSAQPLRLALYYQVSVALLEPEKPTLRAGRVLKYGVFTFTRGAPRLDGSRATVTFTTPDGTAASVETQPAEVCVRSSGLTTGGEVVFFGSDLAGDETTLLIKNKRFTEPIEVPMDWGVIATDTQVFAVVQPAAGPAKILPGIYSAIAKVTTHQMGPDNQMRTFIKTSNEMPFIVTPRIDALAGPTSGIVTVTGAVFKDDVALGEKPTIESIEVFVGPHSLGVGSAPGKFEVLDENTIRFRFPIPGINSNETVPFRVIINGAESAPNWVTAP